MYDRYFSVESGECTRHNVLCGRYLRMSSLLHLMRRCSANSAIGTDRFQVRTRRRFLLRVSGMNARRATILPYFHCVLLGEQRRVHYAPSLEEECSCILPSCSLLPTGMSGSTSTRIRRVVRWDVVHSERACIAENRVSPKERPCDGRLAHVVCTNKRGPSNRQKSSVE